MFQRAFAYHSSPNMSPASKVPFSNKCFLVQSKSKSCKFVCSKSTLVHTRNAFGQPLYSRQTLKVQSASNTASSPSVSSSKWSFLTSNLSSSHDKEIFNLALPALATFLLEPINGAITAAIVGQLGTQQLSAFTLGNLVVQFFLMLFIFLVSLTTPAVAEAAARKEPEKVSRIAAKGLWVGLIAALTTTLIIVIGAPTFVGFMKPPEAQVAELAVTMMRVRSLGVLPILLSFVANGTLRGIKDTRTPLYSAGISATISLALNFLFVYGLGWGVVGSAIANTTASSIAGFGLVAYLITKGVIMPKHMVQPPSLKEVLPLLSMGSMMTIRNSLTMATVLYGSSLCVQRGAAMQVSFEVLRQVWLLTVSGFACFDVAAQSMCAAFLGLQMYTQARAVLQRVAVLGLTTAACLGGMLWVGRFQFISIFTKDPSVVLQAGAAFPLICTTLWVDALATIMDGSLLAARQSNYFSMTQILSAIVQISIFYFLGDRLTSPVAIWTVFKLSPLFRAGGGFFRNYISPKSAYFPRAAAEPVVPVVVEPLQAEPLEVGSECGPVVVEKSPSLDEGDETLSPATAVSLAETSQSVRQRDGQLSEVASQTSQRGTTEASSVSASGLRNGVSERVNGSEASTAEHSNALDPLHASGILHASGAPVDVRSASLSLATDESSGLPQHDSGHNKQDLKAVDFVQVTNVQK